MDYPTPRSPDPRGEEDLPACPAHTAAMRLLNAGVDTTVVALWLGHESVATTQIYVRQAVSAESVFIVT